jgi:hypothetical protein
MRAVAAGGNYHGQLRKRLKMAAAGLTLEAQEGAPAFAGDGLHLVVFLAHRSLRSEIAHCLCCRLN